MRKEKSRRHIIALIIGHMRNQQGYELLNILECHEDAALIYRNPRTGAETGIIYYEQNQKATIFTTADHPETENHLLKRLEERGIETTLKAVEYFTVTGTMTKPAMSTSVHSDNLYNGELSQLEISAEKPTFTPN